MKAEFSAKVRGRDLVSDRGHLRDRVKLSGRLYPSRRFNGLE
jgi:hypothetical protein